MFWGLRQEIEFKRKHILNKPREGTVDVLSLQETHLTQKVTNLIRKKWNVEYFLGGSSTTSNGVSTILKNMNTKYIIAAKMAREYLLLSSSSK